ncbi:hypothetical protein ACF1BS_28045 [Streptomyces sp. NPDC014748]|uniref:hypothetical protein n=1 Tax=unclassified Streptomyces TaxID=2593676 RepID=UPI0018EF7D29|nr:hypothetical protein [Streptomyces sp. GMY02]
MPGPPTNPRTTGGETAALVTQLMDELTRLLVQDAAHPPAETCEEADARRRALVRLRVLAGVKKAVRRLEDQAARTAAANGAGYPEIGQAVSMSRQGARRRWPGLITNGTHRPHPHPTPRSS